MNDGQFGSQGGGPSLQDCRLCLLTQWNKCAGRFGGGKCTSHALNGYHILFPGSHWQTPQIPNFPFFALRRLLASMKLRSRIADNYWKALGTRPHELCARSFSSPRCASAVWLRIPCEHIFNPARKFIGPSIGQSGPYGWSGLFAALLRQRSAISREPILLRRGCEGQLGVF